MACPPTSRRFAAKSRHVRSDSQAHYAAAVAPSATAAALMDKAPVKVVPKTKDEEEKEKRESDFKAQCVAVMSVASLANAPCQAQVEPHRRSRSCRQARKV